MSVFNLPQDVGGEFLSLFNKVLMGKGLNDVGGKSSRGGEFGGGGRMSRRYTRKRTASNDNNLF
ncbi:hypothetical protein AGMMS49975_23090 [Clostridia bacterium]|nr:hypothetical protein AGMMS49975_23090 [Clostridia bacterium]